MSDESKYHIYTPFEIGWSRARKRFNHATRRQIKMAEKKNQLDEFAVGWYLSKIFRMFQFNHHQKKDSRS